MASGHLCLLCVCHRRVGHNEIIGVMRVGCNAEGLGRDHWNEMLAYPRKPIAHWHPLLEPKKSEKEVGVLEGVWGGGQSNLQLTCLPVSPAVEGQDGQLRQPGLLPLATAPRQPLSSSSSPVGEGGGLRPPDDPRPVCLMEEKQDPAVPLSLALSLSLPRPPFLQE